MIQISLSRFSRAAVALAAALMLAACGGGDDGSSSPKVGALKVMGDSLADVGTFGLKFTIQGNPIYPELIAQSYGLGGGCSFFRFTGTTFATDSTLNCTNFAVGGGVINPASSALSAQDPRGLAVQFSAANAAGSFHAGDLLLIDGGGNDAAALVSAYLKAPTDGAAAYTALLGSLLSSAQVSAAAAGGTTGLAGAGATYMSALADRMATLITTQALDRGLQRVAVLNMPAITRTPRFQMVLASITASAGATASAQSAALFDSWVSAYNSRLLARLAGDSRVAVIDFQATLDAQVASPATYGLSNASTPACPVTGTGSDGLPTYTFATCTDAALAASPPTGVTGSDWYKRHAFSDGFHPTPYGHQLMADMIRKALVAKGWL
ncbi:MAG: SGNH/GDSL hydrolase family protein [Sphaerotilus sulfidivorans]|uniref:SGNH/GDSL hydrolase family protein n=1 Tax=Sphaerotilus sulfidivorans TaxID=639200 RepID=UPI003F385134